MSNYSLLINTHVKEVNAAAVLNGAESFIGTGSTSNIIQTAFNNVAQSGTVTVTHGSNTTGRIVQVYELQAEQTGISNTTLDFDLADESQFIQENSTNGTDFRDGTLQLHREGSTNTVDDDFTTLNTLRWNIVKWGNATVTLAAGKVHLAVPYNNITSDRAFLYDNFTFIGDFDVQVSFSGLTNNMDNYHCGIDIKNQVLNIGYVNVYRNNNGWFSNIGGNLITFGTTATYGGLRITRVGSTFTTYYSNDAIPESWTTLDSRTLSSNNEINFSLKAGTAYEGGSVTVDFDNFKVNYGVHYDYSSGGSAPNTKWVTTSDYNHIALEPITIINSMDITTVLPLNTDIGVLISFDNRTTWKTWSGSEFVTHSGLDTDTDWSTVTEIESAFTSYTVTDEIYLDFAFLLEAAHASMTPSVDQVMLNYNEAGLYQLQDSNNYAVSNKSDAATPVTKLYSGTSNIKVNVLLAE